jgi:hypothetical protein
MPLIKKSTQNREPTPREKALSLLKEHDPNCPLPFIQVYMTWVELGFPAHDPKTKTYRRAKKYVNKLLNGTLFESLPPYSTEILVDSIHNFHKMHLPEYEPINKGWLKGRRNLATFFYSDRGMDLFKQCLFEPEPAVFQRSEKNKYKDKWGVAYEEYPKWWDDVVVYSDKEIREIDFSSTDFTKIKKVRAKLFPQNHYPIYTRDIAEWVVEFESVWNKYGDKEINDQGLTLGYSDAMLFLVNVFRWLEVGNRRQSFPDEFQWGDYYMEKVLDFMVEMDKDKLPLRAHLFSEKIFNMAMNK